MGTDKEILTIEDVAELLNLSKRTIYSLLKSGKLPGIKIGGQWRFSRKMLLEMFNREENQILASTNNEVKKYETDW